MSQPSGCTLYVEQPYAYTAESDLLTSVCSHCLQLSAKLRCSACNVVHYCSEECHKEGWKDHMHECEAMRRLYPNVPGTTTRLIARILWKQREQPQVNGNATHAKREFSQLISHQDNMLRDANRIADFRSVLNELKSYLDANVLSSVSEADLLEVYGKVEVNSQGIVNDFFGGPIGIGLYLDLSLLDHSCDPDCLITFEGPTAYLRPCKPGVENKSLNQLRISYINVLADTKERQEQLASRYYFECTCQMCQDMFRDGMMHSYRCENAKCTGFVLPFCLNGVSTSNLTCTACHARFSQRNDAVDQENLLNREMTKLDDVDDPNKLYSVAMALLNKVPFLHQLNINRYKLICKLAESCKELSDQRHNLVAYYQAMLTVMRAYAPKIDNDLAVFLLDLSRILPLDRAEDSKRLKSEGLEIMRICYPQGHPFLQRFMQM